MPGFRYGHAAVRRNGGMRHSRALRNSVRVRPTSVFFMLPTCWPITMDDILARFREATGVQTLGGKCRHRHLRHGAGISGRAGDRGDGGDFEPGSFRVFSGIADDADVDVAQIRCGNAPANFAIVHVDPHNELAGGLIARLAERVGKRISGRGAYQLEAPEPGKLPMASRRRSVRSVFFGWRDRLPPA